MNNRAVTLSLMFGVLAVFFIQSYVSSVEEQSKRSLGTQVTVIVASRDVKEMEELNETMLETRNVPKTFVEPAAVAFEQVEGRDNSSDLRKLVGTVAMVPIKKGEQLTYNKISEPSLRTGLAPQVTPGRRAITMPVNEVSGIGKLVKPGDRVDVIAVFENSASREGKSARIILQDTPVLAVGKYVTNNVPRLLEMEGNKIRTKSLVDYDAFSTVTLEVDPADAQMVSLVVASGSALSLSLRNNDDSEKLSLPTLQLKEVIDGTRRLPASVPGLPGLGFPNRGGGR